MSVRHAAELPPDVYEHRMEGLDVAPVLIIGDWAQGGHASLPVGRVNPQGWGRTGQTAGAAVRSNSASKGAHMAAHRTFGCSTLRQCVCRGGHSVVS